MKSSCTYRGSGCDPSSGAPEMNEAQALSSRSDWAGFWGIQPMTSARALAGVSVQEDGRGGAGTRS